MTGRTREALFGGISTATGPRSGSPRLVFFFRSSLLACACLLASPSSSRAEAESPEPLATRAPRANELSLGYGFMPATKLPLNDRGESQRPMGLALEARHLWQVRGLDGNSPAWIGFGASLLANVGSASRNSFLIDYGIFVRHAFIPRPRARMFVGYGLGAAQVFVRDVSGRGIGHLTLLTIGTDLNVNETLHATVELGYRFVVLPSFATEIEPSRRYDSHGLRLIVGLFFGR